MIGLLVAMASAPGAAQQSLSAAEVGQIISQAAAEATARGRAATIAVVDRVGNVLGVFRMNGAAATATVTSGRGVTTGIEGVAVPDTLAAIAKAITGAYLSSGGNAFTTRTANQIVQEHLNPGETFAPSGPLFGVQFSQLPCSDLSARFFTAAAPSGLVNAAVGPKRSPLGLSADPGGLPLYKQGEVVGAIGAIGDGVYGLDAVITDIDDDDDELIAVAGTVGFAAPLDIRANRITVEGKSLRFTDRGAEALKTDSTAAPAFAAISGGVVGSLVAVTGYSAGALIDGQAFGQAGSGVREDTSGIFEGQRAFILVDGTNTPRFAPRAGTDGLLTQVEVTQILIHALKVAYSARAQIRRPLGSHAQVTVTVVDTNGAILGIARTPDGPLFGTDVSLQKARTAAFFSNPGAAADLNAAGATIAAFVTNVQDFIGPSALTDGTAFADRSGGNLSRPYYPDGIDGSVNGPFSRPFEQWSPFSTGLQLALVINNIVAHINFVTGASAADTPARCTGLPLQIATASNRLPNGIQIFPGSVPIYRGATLIGAIGVSGDGVDQDDMIAFLGLHNASIELATGIGNAPQGIRADTLTPRGIRLRYVACPFAPFLDSTAQNPCRGK